MVQTRRFDDVDYEAFAKAVKALGDEAAAQMGEDDLRHLRKIERWGRLCTLVGYATAWLVPNPVSAYLISQGSFTRWTTMMHHVGHRGYDRVPGVPPRFTSKVFAQGWRRFIDFFDWLLPDGWSQEHNVLHHYHTGDMGDPDLVERDVAWLRNARWPVALKHLVLSYFALTWKFTYYVPRTMRALQYARARRENRIGPAVAETGGVATCDYPYDTRALAPRKGTFSPFSVRGRETWLRCLLPYPLMRFVVVPLLFLPLGPWAATCVLLNSILAEVITNLHTFIVIVPNHAGEDVHRFDTPISDRAEFYLRSVIGSVNYRTGGDFNDFLHGFLNYQIEHHVWPDLPLLRIQQLQPKLKALCEEHGIPYVQDGVFVRVRKLIRILTGQSSMVVGVTVPKDARRGGGEPAPSMEEAAA